MPLLWWLFFIVITRVYFKICWEVADYILLVIGVLGMAALIYSNVPIIARFRQITQKNSSQGQQPTPKQT